MPDFKAEAKDEYGLPRISIDGGKPETTDRGATRAPILIGGTVTGKQFQTDAVDPRITIDSTALICHNSAGVTTVTIDIATGNLTVTGGTITGATFQTSAANPKVIMDSAGFRAVNASAQNTVNIIASTAGSIDLLTSAGVSASLRFRNLTPTTIGSISIVSGTLLMEGIATPIEMHYNTVAGGGTLPESSVSCSGLFVAINHFRSAGNSVSVGVGGASGFANGFGVTGSDSTNIYDLFFNTAVGTTNYIRLGDTTARLRMGTGASAGTNAVDYIGGKIVFQGTNFYTGTGAGQGLYSASKGVAAAAANQWGSHLNWRHVRTDTAGNAVVPGSVTLGTVITNVNSNTPQIANLQASGGHFKVQATAAGSFEYMAAWTVN